MEVKPFFPADSKDLTDKFLSLKMEALEFLGAGFYAYRPKNKSFLYNRSREKVGGILSLLYFHIDTKEIIPKEIMKIEEDLMPAYSSLIRKIEKKHERA
jgi:hypothetical protein